MPRRVERYLPYVPVPNSEHVYVNGVEQRFNTDYTIENTSHVIIPSAAEIGDKVEITYAHVGQAGAPPPEYNEIQDPPNGAGCTGGMPWQNDETGCAAGKFTWTMDFPFDTVIPDGTTIRITETSASLYTSTSDPCYSCGPLGGVAYLDGWFYFYRGDNGCLDAFNYVTGNRGTGGHTATYDRTFPIALNGNGHSVPSGSRIVGFSMNYYGCGGDRYVKWKP